MHMRRPGRGVLLVAAVSTVVAAGCGGGDDSGGGKVASKPSEPRMKGADTGVAIDVEAPSSGAPVNANAVPTKLAVSSFKVDCRFAARRTAGESGTTTSSWTARS
jgi:hypothetical protein